MLVLSLDEIRPEHAPLVGGKALALARLTQTGLTVPGGFTVTTAAYREFVAANGLGNRIRRELTWRPVSEMRWEEMWDASLRIRNAFLKASLPTPLRQVLLRELGQRLPAKPVAVRSSAPAEDASGQSFAGLHESYLNLIEPDAILKHIQLVWASLWSDAALLYRKELGLDIEDSAMAVVVQEFVHGSRSGVVFGQHPMQPQAVAVEAVHGLNQGLVDGSVQPDRWTLARETGDVIEFVPAERRQQVVPAEEGVALRELPPDKAKEPPLSEGDLRTVHAKSVSLGELFGAPQDTEWTFKGPRFYLLQSRPITVSEAGEGDKRAWYLSLRRSAQNLAELRERIEHDLVPAMDTEARQWAETRPDSLADDALLAELSRRHGRYKAWVQRYWDECIPFAHGVRLFGAFYNDAVQPDDPYEFVQLLARKGLVSVNRNEELRRLAAQVAEDPELQQALDRGNYAHGGSGFWDAIDGFAAELVGGSQASDSARTPVVRLLLEMAKHPPKRMESAGPDEAALEEAFLSHFGGQQRAEAEALLDLGRASYRLRDDDNIYLGRIARRLEETRDEARRRGLPLPEGLEGNVAMRPTGGSQHATAQPQASAGGFALRPRQLTGQPAGPGFASGPVRVIRGPEELAGFRSGEVLVCDSVDPNMTFVLPLAAGIVECRGGMLVHGAIIAREYGIPCVTGVSKAVTMFQNGDQVQVDGYLGIVTAG